MGIPRGLPKFQRRKACIAVFARSAGVFYVAHRGRLEKTGEIHEEKPVYSDREGHFIQRGRGMVYGSGSVYEDKRNHIAEEFAKQAAEELQKLTENESIEDLYIFEPSHVRNVIEKRLPDELLRRLRGRVEGNYIKEHPLELVQRLQPLPAGI